MIILYIKFQYLYFKRWVLGKYGNFIVRMYILFTPNKPIDDSLTEIILQQLLFTHRRNEKKRYEIWQEICRIGLNFGVDAVDKQKDLHLEKLETEDTIRSNSHE